ncbi:ABC transporter ATP-binding protein [Photobacterium atrarenae]|uniref:ABC transporter ATP-binding protein n=1 Tax=Photobacterium atrarenae TaxID=865757 RepID=A0ABY5GIA4_9GAMM|nr:ABC transporter ATP-binding protein [Photobacterium atrarenae]UTV28911.1 ABC transporter ATP-binding protein [Photobacterium atrarenae]
MAPFLEVNQLACRFSAQPVLKDLSFTLAQQEIACLLGPSGCGKTTLLQAIAGFIPLSHGQIRLQGCLLSTPNGLVAPEQRKIGMVFQDYALFPHLTVRDNIRFGLHHLHHSRQQQQAIIDEMLELVQIPALAGQYPHQLSYGQKQRVALARALASQPRLLLMDEPFSSLDTPLKHVLYEEIRAILHAKQITALIVTHDKNEAFALSDNIGLLLQHHIVQWDKPAALFNNPASPDVARFLGREQAIHGVVATPDQIKTELGLIRLPPERQPWHSGTPLTVFLSPEEIALHKSTRLAQGKIIQKVFMGAASLYTLRLSSGLQLRARPTNGDDFQIGEQVGVQIAARYLVAFPRGEVVPEQFVQTPQRVTSAACYSGTLNGTTHKGAALNETRWSGR